MHGVCASFVLGLTALLAAELPGSEPANAQADTRQWRELPLPQSRPGQHPTFASEIAVDRGSQLWLIANNRVYCREGEKFTERVELASAPGTRVLGLFGGGDRDLYAAKTGLVAGEGSLYALRDSKADYVAGFKFDTAPLPFGHGEKHPGIHVTRTGRLINWGRDFLSIFDFEKRIWNRQKIELSEPLFFDFPHTTYVFDNERLLCLEPKLTINHLPKTRSGLDKSRYGGEAWGNDRIVLGRYADGAVLAFDIKSLKEIELDPTISDVKRGYFQQAIRRKDGSLWIVKSSPKTVKGFYRIGPDGEAALIDALRPFDLSQLRLGFTLRTTFDAPDGSLWLVGHRNGFLQFKDGHARRFSWNDGVLGAYHAIVGDQLGNLFAVGSGKVLAYEAPRSESVSKTRTQRWQRFPIQNAPTTDRQGNIWCLSAEHPGYLTKWDGERWHHIDLELGYLDFRMLIDEQGHVLIPNLYSRELPAIDVGPEHRVTKFAGIDAMLVAALKRGVKQIDCEAAQMRCVIDGGKIWFAPGRTNRLRYYDGREWDDVPFDATLYDMYYSPSYGAVFMNEERSCYVYDKGQFRSIGKIDLDWQEPTPRTLLGPQGYRLYDEALVKQSPLDQVIVERDVGGQAFLAVAKPQAASDPKQLTFVRTDPLPKHADNWQRALGGGFWTNYGGGEPRRIFAGRVLIVDLTGAPFERNPSDVRAIYEDRRGNLWFYHSNFLYRCDLHDFTVTAQAVSEASQREVPIRVSVTTPVGQSKVWLFWSFAGEAWRPSDSTDAVSLRFERSGVHNVEIAAMNALGALSPAPARFAINAKLAFPDTVLFAKGPYVVDDVLWELPVRAMPSQSTRQAELVYRVGTDEWRPILRPRFLSMADFAEGPGSIEVAAQEDGHLDPTPLRLDFTYKPDYERMVTRRLERIDAANPRAMRNALRELKPLGSKILPTIRRQAKTARAAAQRAAMLEQFLHELETSEEQSEGAKEEVPE